MSLRLDFILTVLASLSFVAGLALAGAVNDVAAQGVGGVAVTLLAAHAAIVEFRASCMWKTE